MIQTIIIRGSFYHGHASDMNIICLLHAGRRGLLSQRGEDVRGQALHAGSPRGRGRAEVPQNGAYISVYMWKAHDVKLS